MIEQKANLNEADDNNINIIQKKTIMNRKLTN